MLPPRVDQAHPAQVQTFAHQRLAHHAAQEMVGWSLRSSLDRQINSQASIARAIRTELAALYEEVIWLAARPNVTPSMARAWYTHVVAGRLSRRIRHFSGKVSREAIANPNSTLRLEHHARIQTKLTQLVEAHLKLKQPKPRSFVRLVLDSENVHIVTFSENYAAMRNDGDYRKSGIKRVPWSAIPKVKRGVLWAKMLRGKVANAKEFAP